MQLLIVDDDLDKNINDEICFGLTEKGFKVTVARTGLEAWKYLAIEQYDLILMDIKLPRGSGNQ